MTGNFGLEILWLVLYCASSLSFILAVGVYAVPEKKKFIPLWLRVPIILLFLVLVIIQVYLTCCVASSNVYRRPRTSSGRLKSSLTITIANTYPYNAISFSAAGLNSILGYILYRKLLKHRTKK